MKKTFLTRRNALFSSGIPFWISVSFFIFVVLVIRVFAPNFFWYALAPVYRVADDLSESTHYFISGFKNIAELSAQNEKLTNEKTALENENQALVQKISAITSLKSSSADIVAGVVVRPPESPYDTFVLSAGENDGVTLGMEAFGAGGIPIGTVSSVLANFSRITLFSAPDIITNGWIGNEKIPVTLNGIGGGAFNASISRVANVVVGDNVFISGPGALPIGKIIKIEDDPSSSTMSLRIAPSINIFSLTWVALRDAGVGFANMSLCATTTK